MQKDTSAILITVSVVNADLQAAYELALSLGEEEAKTSILQVAPFTEEAWTDFSTRLFEKVREAGLLDGGSTARLLAGTVSKFNTKGVCSR